MFVLSMAFISTYCGCVAELQRQNEELNSYKRLLASKADRMPNFASLPAGASVITSKSSDTFGQSFVEMLQSLLYPKQLTVMQPASPLIPGQCWSFAGDRGHLHIRLANPIQITHVTIGHIGKAQSPTGFIPSAPRMFSVFGMKTHDSEEKFLGKFVYDQNGPSFQIFSLRGLEQNYDEYQHVRLQVDNNWGNAKYTCLYNFRVHGKIPTRPSNIAL